MRKTTFILAFIGLLIASCDKKSPTELMTEKASSQIGYVVSKVVADPNASTQDLAIMFETDSITVMHFTLKARNGFGGYVMNRMEYIYGVCKDGTERARLEKTDWSESLFIEPDDVVNDRMRALSGIKDGAYTSEDSVRYFIKAATAKIKRGVVISSN